MKRNLLLLVVLVSAVMLFSSHSWAQCQADTVDLGICDTVYVETVPCDVYYNPAVDTNMHRIAFYVTHDENVLSGDVMDSIAGFVFPFNYRVVPKQGSSCTWDSVTIPKASNWNNDKQDPSHALFAKSIFRHIDCGGTIYNRIATTVGPPDYYNTYSTVIDLGYDAVGDTGHIHIAAFPQDGSKAWWGGSHELFATITFFVFGMDRENCFCPDNGIDICLDTTSYGPGYVNKMEFTRIDAVNYKPRDGSGGGDFLDICDNICIIPNLPPECTQIPGNESHHVNGPYSSSPFTNTDPDGQVVSVTGFVTPAGSGITGVAVVLDPPGVPAPSVTGHVNYNVVDHCQTGDYDICIVCMDDKGAVDTCCFTVTLVNNAPVITTCPDNDTASNNYFREGETWCSTPFAGTDPDNDPLAWSVSSTPPTAGPGPYISGNKVCWDPVVGDTCITYTFELILTDPPQPTADTCYFMVHLWPTVGLPNVVEIPNKVWQRYGFNYCYVYDTEDDRVVLHDKCPEYISGAANPGDFVSIPIVLKNFVDPVDIGAFEFEVEFDYIDLTFYGAERGDLLWAVWTAPYEDDPSQDVLWSWEYFSYRLCPCTVPACQKYKILVYGQAEMPDGLLRRGYCITLPDLDENIAAWDRFDPPLDLVWFKFQVANNELLRDLKLPVAFEWEAKIEDGVVVDDWDCAENTMSNCDGDLLYASSDDIQFADLCFEAQQNPPEDILTFIDGGIHICSPCSGFKCVRGDINLDHIANSAADAVMLARAIVLGTHAVFTLDYDAQMCASDINADGRPAMLADLIYLIRVIQRDAVAYPKLGPSSEIANVIVSDGMISVECGAEIGGLLFEFDQTVTPTLLATNMDILAHEGRVLVWSSDGNSISSGEVLTAVGAELVSVTAVDRDGRDLATTINAKVAPSAFALHPAYPNPFNPYTNLSFTLPTASFYTMKIYNVAGQLVRSYAGMGAAGLNMVTWDGKDNTGNEVASGVYFYKLVTGQHHAIKKMVMLK
jgi:hypothetical protein